MVKSCGGCTYFLKMKNDKHSSGMCCFKDGRVNTDFVCDNWKGIKYNRSKIKEIEDAL